MGLHLSRRGYSVRVVLLRDSRFLIQAGIAHAERLSKEERMRLTPLEELDLLLGIEGAELRGREVDAGDEPLPRAKTQPARPAGRRAGLLGRGGQPGLAVLPVQEV